MAARPASRPALAAITCPTLVLCGAKDVLTPAAFNAALLDILTRRPGA
jgi:pimeloyl-ACP methyl ester carboxylesterase